MYVHLRLPSFCLSCYMPIPSQSHLPILPMYKSKNRHSVYMHPLPSNSYVTHPRLRERNRKASVPHLCAWLKAPSKRDCKESMCTLLPCLHHIPIPIPGLENRNRSACMCPARLRNKIASCACRTSFALAIVSYVAGRQKSTEAEYLKAGACICSPLPYTTIILVKPELRGRHSVFMCTSYLLRLSRRTSHVLQLPEKTRVPCSVSCWSGMLNRILSGISQQSV